MPVFLEVRSDVEAALLGWLPLPDSVLDPRPGAVVRFLCPSQTPSGKWPATLAIKPTRYHFLELSLARLSGTLIDSTGANREEVDRLAFVVDVPHFHYLRQVGSFVELGDLT